MAEQLRGDQVTGIAAQFTLTKARPDVWERFVDGAGDEFLACAGLPSDQKRWCQQGRTLAIRERTAFKGFEVPTISSKTLDHRIKALKIDKKQFSNPSADAKDHKSPANNAVDFAGHCKFSGSIT